MGRGQSSAQAASHVWPPRHGTRCSSPIILTIPEVYGHWAAERTGIPLEHIQEVNVHTIVGEGSSDSTSSDFSTFAGQEIFSLWIITTDGRSRSHKLYDANPVNAVMAFAERHGITIGGIVVGRQALTEQALRDAFA
jgi:hypothetical protein